MSVWCMALEMRERGESKWELSLCISSSDERQNGRVEQSQTGTLRLYPFCASASKYITTRGSVSLPTSLNCKRILWRGNLIASMDLKETQYYTHNMWGLMEKRRPSSVSRECIAHREREEVTGTDGTSCKCLSRHPELSYLLHKSSSRSKRLC
jgi:hypothetical protein